MKKVFLVFAAAALCLAQGLGGVAWGAATNYFDVIGGTEGVDWEFNDAVVEGKLIIKTNTPVTIANIDPTTATQNVIEVVAGVTADITLDGVNIDIDNDLTFSDTHVFYIGNGSSVTLTLSGDNTLKSSTGYSCPLNAGTGSDLTIKGGGKLSAIYAGPSGVNATNAISSSGEVSVIGGTVIAETSVGNAIGVGKFGFPGEFTIEEDAAVTASGITGINVFGDLTIKDSTVTATGIPDGSNVARGIQASGELNIENSTVTATGDDYGIDTKDFTMTSGTVTAVGNDAGTGSAVNVTGDITLPAAYEWTASENSDGSDPTTGVCPDDPYDLDPLHKYLKIESIDGDNDDDSDNKDKDDGGNDDGKNKRHRGRGCDTGIFGFGALALTALRVTRKR